MGYLMPKDSCSTISQTFYLMYPQINLVNINGWNSMTGVQNLFTMMLQSSTLATT